MCKKRSPIVKVPITRKQLFHLDVEHVRNVLQQLFLRHARSAFNRTDHGDGNTEGLGETLLGVAL
jgi:hypothetical protein